MRPIVGLLILLIAASIAMPAPPPESPASSETSMSRDLLAVEEDDELGEDVGPESAVIQ